jgi:acrylyl-CoA reductase (NADPH)
MPSIPITMRCFLVEKQPDDSFRRSVATRPLSELPEGEVLIRVRYSSLNYKDALAATGHPGITKTFPHIPGIDAAGTVAESSHPRFQPGEEVIMTGHELGVERWGGWAEYVRVPGDWLVPLPEGLTLEESMILGTAGFTAAQCVQALLHQRVTPEKGEVLVTGATGGVGCLAVMILARLGYRVVAVTGKQDRHDWLKRLGAVEVAGRELLEESKPRPLQPARFAGGIDTVGGAVLSSLVKRIGHRGCVACCGVAGGAALSLTVYPFILRGVTLAGIDSAWCPDEERPGLWQHLASDWKPQHLDEVKRHVPLEEMEPHVEAILQGQNTGRVVVDV